MVSLSEGELGTSSSTWPGYCGWGELGASGGPSIGLLWSWGASGDTQQSYYGHGGGGD